ncbi:MAG: carbohydrate-binding domain-containing protein, partial [Actinomycetes bacterium]
MQGKVNLATTASQIMVRMKTDDGSNGGASAKTALDGVAVATQSVTATTWASFTYGRSVGSGSHTLSITFTNPKVRNLFIDSTQFLSDVTPTPTRPRPRLRPRHRMRPETGPTSPDTRTG